jgi:lysophospholipase
VKPEVPRVFIAAHSLGGAVAVLVNDEHPDDVQAMALSAPMLDIKLGAFPAPVAASLGEGVCGITDGTGYVLGAGDYKRETDFENSSVTNSRNRWAWKLQQLDEDPGIRLGGTTWRWLCQSLDASTRASMSGRYSSTPTLMFIAGKDTIVNPPGQEKYCAEAPRCTLERLTDSKHEVFAEVDAVRNLAVSHVVKFFDAEVTP